VSLTLDEIKDDVAKLAMPLLIERLGGTVTITETEFQLFVDRHGGNLRNIGVQIERAPGGLRLTIVHKERPPAN
jgi:hypothetical protein